MLKDFNPALREPSTKPSGPLWKALVVGFLTGTLFTTLSAYYHDPEPLIAEAEVHESKTTDLAAQSAPEVFRAPAQTQKKTSE